MDPALNAVELSEWGYFRLFRHLQFLELSFVFFFLLLVNILGRYVTAVRYSGNLRS